MGKPGLASSASQDKCTLIQGQGQLIKEAGPLLRQETGDREAGLDLLILGKDKVNAVAVVLPAEKSRQVTPGVRARGRGLEPITLRGTVLGFQ